MKDSRCIHKSGSQHRFHSHPVTSQQSIQSISPTTTKPHRPRPQTTINPHHQTPIPSNHIKLTKKKIQLNLRQKLSPQTTTSIHQSTPIPNPKSKMPATPKSYLPAFAAFLAFGISYTTIVATKEGATIDGARTRWQGQHASARRVLSGGMSMENMEKMGGK